MKRELVKHKRSNNEYQSSVRHTVVINGVSEKEIRMRFSSTSRDNTQAVVEVIDGKIIDIKYSKDMRYAAGCNMHKEVLDHIKIYFGTTNEELSQDLRNTLLNIFLDCIQKCESRYGNSVKDYDDIDADAIVYIKGEDDGKPKWKVDLYKEEFKNQEDVDDFGGPISDIAKFTRELVDLDKGKITWNINRENISHSDLCKALITEFDNPYLLIVPNENLDIILDFDLNVDKYIYL